MSKDTNSGHSVQIKIPEVRFNLKAHKKTDIPVLISAFFRYEGKRLVYTTCEHVIPKYWNPKTRRCKESVNYTDGAIINEALEEIRNTIRSTYRDKFAGKEVEVSQFKAELDYRLGRKKRPTKVSIGHKSLLEFIDFEIEKNKVRVNGLIGGQTWQKYQTVKKRLEDFSIETGFDIKYENFNESFREDFILWMESKKLSQNTIDKEVVTLRTLFKRSRKYHNCDLHLDPDFKVVRVKTSKHYPTLEELKHLFEFKFENPKHRKIVDLYLVSAFGGGLRISDVLSLTKDNETEIDGQKVLHVFTYKGRELKSDNEVVIPITPQLQQLIEKYNWEFPKYSEQEINRSLKEAFKEAELDRQELIKSGVKGKKPELKALHEVVHFHTARSAYIDFMMNDLDISAEELRRITGQSLKVLLSYERGDKKKNAIKVGAKINKQLQGLTVVKSDVV